MSQFRKFVQIQRRRVGFDAPCFIIAEAGVNHNGQLQRALKLIDEAKSAGADCVKFQTFKAVDLVTTQAPKARYQLLQTNPRESQLKMLQKLELSYEDHFKLKAHCRKRGLLFLSTPYGFKDVDFLDQLGVPAFKVASGQLVEPVFLQYVARKGKPVLLSTGMGTMKDVEEAVHAFEATGNRQLLLLQCTTNYPSRLEDAHLRVIPEFARRFRIPVGYSDHTTGPHAALAAIALGACVIEKHFTLDKSLPGPDHAASMNPRELTELVRTIREVENALGGNQKQPNPTELLNAKAMRRSLATAQFIPKGATLQASMLTLKRPATGIPPREWSSVLGRKVRQNIPADQLLTYSMLTSHKG
jgi:N,N'-diacetyllegionaminate synthase